MSDDLGDEGEAPWVSPTYYYRFTYLHHGEARRFVLKVTDRREFLVRVLKRLPAELEKSNDPGPDHDAVADEANRITARLREWLGSFLADEEVNRLIGPPSVLPAVPPNCS